MGRSSSNCRDQPGALFGKVECDNARHSSWPTAPSSNSPRTVNSSSLAASASYRHAEFAATNNPSRWVGLIKVKTPAGGVLGYMLLYANS